MFNNEYQELEEKQPPSTFTQYKELYFFKLFFDEYSVNLIVLESNNNFKYKLKEKYGKECDKKNYTYNSILIYIINTMALTLEFLFIWEFFTIQKCQIIGEKIAFVILGFYQKYFQRIILN